ncbi:COQ9 family protein [Sphingomicrobium sediminis]|uniref:COQ9 family protein n=1 Tax=Sphingomicrobium sediminis TaxID=2950949 RepID=A0A9X2J496_9SPHN|nr:COQ9 family protein [Sphingomicrobium sediminis]MCM8558131.1 COQ9 family protein [Sphingomicrobium sediminis]
MAEETPLDATRRKLALAVAENAVFDGWSEAAVVAAADQHDIDHDVAKLAFPKDPAQMVAAWIEAVDAAMEAAFTREEMAGMKVRERIRALIWFRLELAGPAREAVRTGLSILSLPQNLALAAKTAWRSADTMWRMAGDTATDYNHYTKRAILTGVYGSTLYAWLDDDSEGWAETAAFLDRRIDDVMQFEKVKAKWLGGGQNRFSMSRFLGRLRYPPA